MKKLTQIFLCFILFTSYANALEFQLFHPCEKKIQIKSEILLNESENALNITLQQLKAHKIPHVTMAGGIKSIFELSEDKNLQIIDGKNFIAYGWCYSVNGQFPEIMPDQYMVVNTDVITWFLGSSHYRDGQWVTYCQPVHESENNFYCKE